MKKRLFLALALTVALIATITLSIPTFATDSTTKCSGVETNIIECDGGGDAGIWHILRLIINILSVSVGIVAVIGISIFGVQYLTAGGDINKTTKAKRRMFEISLGLVAWVLLYAASQWLLPGGRFNLDSNITSVTLTVDNGTHYVGNSYSVEVTLENADGDNTFSLDLTEESKNSAGNKIVEIKGNTHFKCVGEGTASIEAIASNGVKSNPESITCTTKPDDVDYEVANNGSNSGNSSSSSSTSGNSSSSSSTSGNNTSSAGDDTDATDNDTPPPESSTGLTKAEHNWAYDQLRYTNEATETNIEDMASAKGIESPADLEKIINWSRCFDNEDSYFGYLAASALINNPDQISSIRKPACADNNDYRNIFMALNQPYLKAYYVHNWTESNNNGNNYYQKTEDAILCIQNNNNTLCVWGENAPFYSNQMPRNIVL